MALIGKIREKSWLLIAVIGIAMLAFIAGDFDFFGGGPQEDNYGIGTVNGEMVNETTYNQYINNAQRTIAQRKLRQNPDQQPRLTDKEVKQAKQQAWQSAVAENLMQDEYKKIGLIVDEFELENVLYGLNGYSPSSISMQFKDSITGEFKPDQLRNAITQLEGSNDPEQVQRYKNIMSSIRQVRKNEKYIALLQAGMHSTTLEGKLQYEGKKTVKNVSYVYKPYTQVPNEAIEEPTKKEVKAYFEKHKNEEKYQMEPSREISYFAIPVNPSKSDSSYVLDRLKKIEPKFKKAKNDSLFVMRYSDLKVYRNDSTAVAHPEGSQQQGPTYPLAVADQIENASSGDIVGPYSTRNGLTLSKIIRYLEEETATVRHILLKAKTPVEIEKAQTKADSIVRVIRSKDNFTEMVTQFSEDAPASVAKGGKYENFAKGSMVPEFEDFSFNKSIGTLGTVKTRFGIHIIEVLGKEATNRPILASIVKQVAPRKLTFDDVIAKASDYIYNLDKQFEGQSIEKKVNLFDTLARENRYNVRSTKINDESPSVQGFESIAENRILSLAYSDGAQEGDIVSSPIRDNNRIIVGFISEIIKEGTPSLKSVEDRMRAEVRKEKQGEYLVNQMIGMKDLDALAQKMQVKMQSEGITFSSKNIAAGNEPMLIGTAFSGLLDGEKSVPVVGKNGVFVLRIDKTVLAEETTDYSAEIQELNSQRNTTIQNRYRSALLESATIVDNRKLRQYGIR